MNDSGPRAGTTPVQDYKRVLQRVLENRPSGTRQLLATALGTNRSFVSQMANPAYPMPVPYQHLETIFQVCHFAQAFDHAENLGSTCLCVFQALQHKRACAFRHNESIAVFRERLCSGLRELI